MNIHITDSNLFESLKKATIVKCLVGSRLYNTASEKSDYDYLNIYATSENELLSFIQTNHQLQYKTENEDHNFVSLHSFIRNIINGDSSINYEVIVSDSLLGTELEWLTKHKDTFTTYTVVRNYLGLCNRDIKHYSKYTEKYDKEKRLRHVIRGYIYARDMIKHTFDFNACNEELKSITLNVENDKQIKEYRILVTNLRNELTEKFNDKSLGYAQHIDVTKGIEVTNELLNYCKTNNFLSKQNNLSNFNLDLFINSFENWVNY